MTEVNPNNFFIFRGHSSIIGINQKDYNQTDITDETIINDFTFTIPDGFTFITLHEIGELSGSNTTSKYIFNSIKEIGNEHFIKEINDIIATENKIEVNTKLNNLKKKMIRLYLVKLYREYVKPNYNNLITKLNILFDEIINFLTKAIVKNNDNKEIIIDIAKKHIDELNKVYFDSISEYVEFLKEICKEYKFELCHTYIEQIRNIKQKITNEINISLDTHIVNYLYFAFGDHNVGKMINDKKKEYSLTIQKSVAWTHSTSATFRWIDDKLVNDTIKALNFNINIFKSGSKIYKLRSDMELSHKIPNTNTRTIYYNGFWPLNEYLQLENYSYVVNEPFDANNEINRNKFRSKLYPDLINNDNIFLEKLLYLSEINRQQLIILCDMLKQSPEKIITKDEYNHIIETYSFINYLVNGFNFTGRTYQKLLKNIEGYKTKLLQGTYIFNTCGSLEDETISPETKKKITNILNSIKFNNIDNHSTSKILGGGTKKIKYVLKKNMC